MLPAWGCRARQSARHDLRAELLPKPGQRPAGLAAFRAESQARHLPVPIGRPSQMELFDYKPRLKRFPGHRSAGFHPQRTASHRHVRHAVKLPGGAFQVLSLRSTASPAPGSANCCRTRPRSPTTSLFVKSVHTEAINHDPAVTMSANRLSAWRAGPAWAPGSPMASAARTQDLPAFVVMISPGRHGRPAAVRPPLGQRLSAQPLSRREVPLRRRSGFVPVRPQRIQHRATAATFSTTLAKLNKLELAGIRRSGNRHAHRAI